jgi:hypothetical protein
MHLYSTARHRRVPVLGRLCMSIIFCVVYLTLINIANALVQDTLYFPSARDIDVIVNAEVEMEDHQYIFTYKLTSTELSEQDIDQFFFKLQSNVIEQYSPDMWHGSISVQNTLIWGSLKRATQISPSSNLESFGLNSNGLPAIITYHASGDIETPKVPMGNAPPLELIVGGDIFENSVQGKTIGPNDLPDPFDHIDFIDTLMSYIPQSLELDWIGDYAFADTLQNRFQKARHHLVTLDSSVAANILTSIVDLIEATIAGNGPQSAMLTTEGYALLVYNTKYILNRLPDPVDIFDQDDPPPPDSK